MSHDQFMRKTVQKSLFNLGGGLFLILGIAGIILPLVPATPFLLMSAYLFSKGSPEFHRWLLNHRQLGPTIKDWEDKGIIRLHTKWIATIMLSLSGVFIWSSLRIPLFGKMGFSIMATILLVFIWTRPHR